MRILTKSKKNIDMLFKSLPLWILIILVSSCSSNENTNGTEEDKEDKTLELKNGTYLCLSMKTEDAPKAKYETRIIYKNKKTGEKEAFKTKNIPDDTTWEWVETKHKKITEKETEAEKLGKAFRKLANSVTGGNCIYNELQFKGEKTVVIKSMGIEYATSYTKDQEYIRIKTDKSDLLLKIKSNQTLVGEGWAEGVYVKEESLNNLNFNCKTTSKLNMRNGPGKRYKVIDQLSKGTKIKLLKFEKSGWGKVKVNGKTGYVATSYLMMN